MVTRNDNTLGEILDTLKQFTIDRINDDDYKNAGSLKFICECLWEYLEGKTL